MMDKIKYLKSAIKSLENCDKDIRIISAIDKIPQGDIKRLKGEKYLMRTPMKNILD